MAPGRAAVREHQRRERVDQRHNGRPFRRVDPEPRQPSEQRQRRDDIPEHRDPQIQHEGVDLCEPGRCRIAARPPLQMEQNEVRNDGQERHAGGLVRVEGASRNGPVVREEPLAVLEAVDSEGARVWRAGFDKGDGGAEPRILVPLPGVEERALDAEDQKGPASPQIGVHRATASVGLRVG